MKSKMHRHILMHSVVIKTSRKNVWNSLTDWPSQSSWMAMTSVRSVSREEPIGTEIFALTGLFARRNFWLKKYLDRKSTRLNSSHMSESRMPSSA